MALAGKTFTQRAVICTTEVYDRLKHANNSLSVTGQLLGYRKEFVKKIVVPENMIGNDAYTYFLCITSGYKYKYVPTAISYFTAPKTLWDQIKQNTRYQAVPIRMSKYFGEELVKKEGYIPPFLIAESLVIEFLQHPILCSYIFGINMYCRLRVRFVESKLNGTWAVAHSTKKHDTNIV